MYTISMGTGKELLRNIVVFRGKCRAAKLQGRGESVEYNGKNRNEMKWGSTSEWGEIWVCTGKWLGVFQIAEMNRTE